MSSVNSESTIQEQREKLYDILKGARTAFMVTKAPDGSLHGRPMATAEAEESLGELWFATSRESEKVLELEQDSEVFLGYTKGGTEWATISGTARIIDDRGKVQELWSAFWKNWFDGPDDPNLVLVRVTPRQGEYWDSGSKLLTMAKLALTAVTGKRLDDGDHATVPLQK